jgi:hypothetical protein
LADPASRVYKACAPKIPLKVPRCGVFVFSVKGICKHPSAWRFVCLKPSRAKSHFEVEALEPRLLFSGDGMPCATTTLAQPELASTLNTPTETIPAAIASLNSGEQEDDIFDGLSDGQEIISDLAPAVPAGSEEQEEDLATVDSGDAESAGSNVAAASCIHGDWRHGVFLRPRGSDTWPAFCDRRSALQRGRLRLGRV